MTTRRQLLAALLAVPAGYKQAVAAVKASMGVSAAPASAEISGVAIARRLQEEESALRFYMGDQWPDDVVSRRTEQGRPCIVCNHLPQIVEQILTGKECPPYENNLILSVVRIWRDRQMLHNYLVSAQAEGSLDQAIRPGFDLVQGFTPKIGATIRVRRAPKFVVRPIWDLRPTIDEYDCWTLCGCDESGVTLEGPIGA